MRLVKIDNMWFNPEKVVAVMKYRNGDSTSTIYAGGHEDDYFVVNHSVDYVVAKLTEKL